MSQTSSDDEVGLRLATAQSQAVEQLRILGDELSVLELRGDFPALERAVDLEPMVRALALATRLLTFNAVPPPIDNPISISSFELAEAITALDRSRQAILPLGPAEPLMRALFESVKLLTAMAAANECQLAVPYAPMHQVRKPDGSVVWQCSHSPSEHP